MSLYDRVRDGLCRTKPDLMSGFVRGGGFLFSTFKKDPKLNYQSKVANLGAGNELSSQAVARQVFSPM